MTGIISGIHVPWPGVPQDACTTLNVGDCPLEIGEEVNYHADIEIMKEYPAVSTIVLFNNVFVLFIM